MDLVIVFIKNDGSLFTILLAQKNLLNQNLIQMVNQQFSLGSLYLANSINFLNLILLVLWILFWQFTTIPVEIGYIGLASLSIVNHLFRCSFTA